MKRKTNLFYLNGPDSKFITFSNYTEALTGNFLSTDTKLFPSRFMALNIKGLTAQTKPALIKYLTQYYESKLAVLRDGLNSENIRLDHNVLPLNYLLEALYKITEIGTEGSNGYVKYAAQPDFTNTEIVSIEYVSDITEQDYNGTYTDTICIVSLDSAYSATVVTVDDGSKINDNAYEVDIPVDGDDNPTLYGWEEHAPTSDYADAVSIFDAVDGTVEGLDGVVYAAFGERLNAPNGSVHNGGGIPSGDLIPYDGGSHKETDDDSDDGSSDDSDDGEVIPVIFVKDSLEWHTEDMAAGKYVILSFGINNAYPAITKDPYYDYENKVIEVDADGNVTTTDLQNNAVYLDIVTGKEWQWVTLDGKFNLVGGTPEEPEEDDSSYGTPAGQYNLGSYISKLKLQKVEGNSISFNAIIPLFDVVDINYKSNFSIIEETYEDPHSGEINQNENAHTMNLIDDATNNLYTKNVPLGMWFYTKGVESLGSEGTDCDCCDTITLHRDPDTGFSQSWSLVISSQFKPFPYSRNMPNEIYTNSSSNAFATFAQILSRQNEMIDTFNDLKYQFSYLANRLANIEVQMNQIGTSYNIDQVQNEMINFEVSTKKEFENFKEEILSYIASLKWRATI